MKPFADTPGIVEWTLPIFGYEYPLVDVTSSVETYDIVRRAVGLPPCIRYEYVKGGRHTHEDGEYYIEFRDGDHRRLCYTTEDCQEAVESMEQAIREWQLRAESTLTMVKALQRLQPVAVGGSPYSIKGGLGPFPSVEAKDFGAALGHDVGIQVVDDGPVWRPSSIGEDLFQLEKVSYPW